jgi:hypothetical protein
VPPPQQTDQRDRDWIVTYVGKVRDDSLRIINLVREGATEGEVKAAYQAMSRITIQTSTTQDSLVCLMRKQAVEIFPHRTMRTAIFER